MKKLLVHILSVVVTTVFAQAPATLSDYPHGIDSRQSLHEHVYLVPQVKQELGKSPNEWIRIKRPSVRTCC